MKKLVFAVAVCAFLVSCKKIAAGGNQGVLAMEDGVERYDSEESRKAKQEPAVIAVDTLSAPAMNADSTKVEPQATTH
ncbi:hypothetical protein [Chryseobacterium sp. A301]